MTVRVVLGLRREAMPEVTLEVMPAADWEVTPAAKLVIKGTTMS